MERSRLDGSELVAALGLVFVVSGVTLWWESRLPASSTAGAALYELVVHVLFGGVVLALGVHIERSELSPDERFTVMTWCFSAFLFFVGLAAWSNLASLLAVRVTDPFVSDVVVFGSMGAPSASSPVSTTAGRSGTPDWPSETRTSGRHWSS